MQTITIKTNGRTAEIWKESLLVSGHITDEEGKQTIVMRAYSGDKWWVAYFGSYTERTGKDFFAKN